GRRESSVGTVPPPCRVLKGLPAQDGQPGHPVSAPPGRLGCTDPSLQKRRNRSMLWEYSREPARGQDGPGRPVADALHHARRWTTYACRGVSGILASAPEGRGSGRTTSRPNSPTRSRRMSIRPPGRIPLGSPRGGKGVHLASRFSGRLVSLRTVCYTVPNVPGPTSLTGSAPWAIVNSLAGCCPIIPFPAPGDHDEQSRPGDVPPEPPGAARSAQ